MPSMPTPPQTISSGRMVEGWPSCRKSAKPSSIPESSRPFQLVYPGGGLIPVPPYHSNQRRKLGPKSSPVSWARAAWYSAGSRPAGASPIPRAHISSMSSAAKRSSPALRMRSTALRAGGESCSPARVRIRASASSSEIGSTAAASGDAEAASGAPVPAAGASSRETGAAAAVCRGTAVASGVAVAATGGSSSPGPPQAPASTDRATRVTLAATSRRRFGMGLIRDPRRGDSPSRVARAGARGTRLHPVVQQHREELHHRPRRLSGGSGRGALAPPGSWAGSALPAARRHPAASTCCHGHRAGARGRTLPSPPNVLTPCIRGW